MQRAQSFAEQGNTTVFSAGVGSTTVVQGSFPNALVTVYYTGTTQLAPIYSDNRNPPTPLANPFTANAMGYWWFYAPNGRYDVQLSGAGLAAPWTIGDLLLQDMSGPPGPQGPAGPAGPQGPPGQGVALTGVVADSSSLPGTANVGDAFITQNDGHLWVWSGLGWVDTGILAQGPPGPQGPPGTGIQSPWLSNINAAGFSLANVWQINLVGSQGAITSMLRRRPRAITTVDTAATLTTDTADFNIAAGGSADGAMSGGFWIGDQLTNCAVIFIAPTTNYVGIGCITDPQYPLEVNGDINIRNGTLRINGVEFSPAAPSPALSITTTSLAPGTTGTAYSVELAASGGTLPYFWTIGADKPPGFALSSGGLLSGTPTTAGSFAIDFTVTDATSATATATITLVIVSSLLPLSITTANLPAGTVGSTYSAQLVAAGGTPPYSWAATGQPGGITVNSDGSLSGTPITAGTYSVNVTVNDAAFATAVATLPVEIAAQPPVGGPIIYNLRTDRTILQVAPLAAPAAAGQSVVDPNFGTTITRITDQNTYANGNSIPVDGAAFKNNWSSDGAFFNVDSGSLFSRSGQYIRRLAMNPWFAFQTPNLAYGIAGASGGWGICQYDLLADQYTMLFNLDAGSFPNRTQNGGGNGIVVGDYQDDHLGVYFNGGQQDKYRTLAVYRRSTNTYAVMDLDSSSVGGWFPAGTPWTSQSMQPLTDQHGPFSIPNQGTGGNAPSDGFHSIEIDRTGRYVWLALNCYLQAADASGWTSPIFVWDLDTMTFFRWYGLGIITAPRPGGHSCFGFAEVVNVPGAMPEVGTGNWTTAGTYLRPINFSTLATTTGMISLVPSPAPGEWQFNVDAHVSWSSVQPGQHTPILQSQYLGGDSAYSSPGAIPANTLYDNEITAIDPDFGFIYRVCHHRAWYTGDFNTAPHGNVSRQGDKFIFTSNWLGTLQGGRFDVFMVDLPIVG